MYPLNLDIIKCIKRNIEAGMLLNPSLEFSLVLSLDLDELVLEGLVGSVWGELLKVLDRKSVV